MIAQMTVTSIAMATTPQKGLACMNAMLLRALRKATITPMARAHH